MAAEREELPIGMTTDGFIQSSRMEGGGGGLG